MMANDFTEGLRKLVEDTATRVAEGVLQRGLALVEDLQRRADALLRDAEHAKVRWEAAEGIVEMIRKASGSEAGPFSRADMVHVGAIDATRSDHWCDGERKSGLDVTGLTMRTDSAMGSSEFRLERWRDSGSAILPPGRYTVVVSFYRQGTAPNG